MKTKETLKQQIFEIINNTHSVYEKLGVKPILDAFTYDRILEATLQIEPKENLTKEYEVVFDQAIEELKKDKVISEQTTVSTVYSIRGKEFSQISLKKVIMYSYVLVASLFVILTYLNIWTLSMLIIAIGTIILFNSVSMLVGIILDKEKTFQKFISLVLDSLPKCVAFVIITFIANFFLPSLELSMVVGTIAATITPNWSDTSKK